MYGAQSGNMMCDKSMLNQASKVNIHFTLSEVRLCDFIQRPSGIYTLILSVVAVSNLSFVYSEPPSAPTNVRVSAVGTRVATVSWRAPANSFPNSLTAVSSYRITASQDRFRNGNHVVTKNSGAASSHRFTDLEEYTLYSFTVTASNTFGRSQASSAATAKTQQAGMFLWKIYSFNMLYRIRIRVPNNNSP